MKRLPVFWWFRNRRKRIKVSMKHYSAFARDGSKPHDTGGVSQERGGGGVGEHMRTRLDDSMLREHTLHKLAFLHVP